MGRDDLRPTVTNWYHHEKQVDRPEQRLEYKVGADPDRHQSQSLHPCQSSQEVPKHFLTTQHQFPCSWTSCKQTNISVCNIILGQLVLPLWVVLMPVDAENIFCRGRLDCKQKVIIACILGSWRILHILEDLAQGQASERL